MKPRTTGTTITAGKIRLIKTPPGPVSVRESRIGPYSGNASIRPSETARMKVRAAAR